MDLRSLAWPISQVFHLHQFPYQFAPILFCHFLQGLIAFPAGFKMYLQTVKVLNDCLTVRKDADIPACVVLFYCMLYVLHAEPISSVMCNKIRVSTRTFMSHHKCERPNKSIFIAEETCTIFQYTRRNWSYCNRNAVSRLLVFCLF